MKFSICKLKRPITYNLDKKKLSKNFRNYQMEFHPDKIPKKMPEKNPEKELEKKNKKKIEPEKEVENIIYLINKIQSILKNNLKRGYYIV